MRSGKLVIAVGGGPTAVINQSLAGAVLEARLFPQIVEPAGTAVALQRNTEMVRPDRHPEFS